MDKIETLIFINTEPIPVVITREETAFHEFEYLITSSHELFKKEIGENLKFTTTGNTYKFERRKKKNELCESSVLQAIEKFKLDKDI